MNIFLSCQQSPHRYPIPAYDFWADYFRNGLREAGHTLLENSQVDWAKGLMPLAREDREAWITETWTRTLDFIRKQKELQGVDIFLSYLYPQQIDCSAIRTIQKMGIPCVNFFCDNVREFRKLPEEFAPFDLHWVPEFKALPLYHSRGWKALHAPMPCWIPPERRILPEGELPIVSFIGGKDSLRAGLLAEVAKSDLPLEIRGPSWMPSMHGKTSATVPIASAGIRIAAWIEFIQKQGVVAAGRRVMSRFDQQDIIYDFSRNIRPMPEQDAYQTILAESAVSLGINRYPSFRHPSRHPDTYSRLRDIEAPMLGACYLTEWTEGLDQIYDLDTEISTYRDAKELIAVAGKLLDDAPRRRSLRENGQRRALTEHTVGHTLERISQVLGIH